MSSEPHDDEKVDNNSDNFIYLNILCTRIFPNIEHPLLVRLLKFIQPKGPPSTYKKLSIPLFMKRNGMFHPLNSYLICRILIDNLFAKESRSAQCMYACERITLTELLHVFERQSKCNNDKECIVLQQSQKLI